ncbi:hypothetical protein LCGC14_1189580 [marine sediment metagenome]|uniref:Bacterial Ig-like domain-containing protein n=1 Tax=marine sediment metagenome TaxID=412755 RepID=A0A0F9M7K7_9ZZZZ
MIVLIPMIILVNSNKGESGLNSGTGCYCHGSLDLVLTTNYTGNKIDITQGNSFDLRLTISGAPLTTNKGAGYGIWHTSSDSISVPTMLSSNATGTFTELVPSDDEWGSPDYYYGAWWVPVGTGNIHIYAVFRITPSNSVTTETIYLQAAAKNDLASTILTFTINVTAVVVSDTTAPSVSITAPSNNAFVSGTSVSITGTATDSGSGVLGSTVEAYLTNTTGTNNTVSLTYTGPGYSGTWNSESLFDGDYNITVVAGDNDGNANRTEYVTVTVDNTAPTITLDSVIPNPSNGITVITASNTTEALDGSGIKANVSLPGGGYIFPTMTFQGGSTWNGTFDVSSYSDGTFSIGVNGTDLAGNTGFAGPTNINGDLTAPTIILTVTPDPSNGITTIQAFNTTEVISGSLLANVSTPSGYIYPTLTYQGSNEWSGSFDVNSYGDGTYTININGTDIAGNVQYNSTSIYGDITLPSVTITSPTEGETVGGAISITGTASGTGSNIASIYINNSVIWGDASGNPQTDTATDNPSGSFTFNNESYIAPGNYWVEINITDYAGNVNSSIRFFTVSVGDSSPPNIIITVSADPSNGFTNITVTTNEDLDAGGPPLLNITLPNTSVIYRQLYLIASNTWQTNYTVVSDGTHEIAVNATDIALNTGIATKSFEGDLTTPTITLTVTPDPSNGITIIQAFNTTEFVSTMLVNVSTPSGYIYPTLTYQGLNKWTGSFDVSMYGEGPYTVNLNGTDIAGNIGYSTPVIVTGDLAVPTITLSVTPDPSNGITTIQAFNTSEVVSTMLVNVSTPSGYIYPTMVYQGGNKWNSSFTVTENGIHTININGTDLAGNIGYDSFSITGDFSGPIILINNPANNSLFGSAIPPNYDLSITEPNLHRIWYNLNNNTNSSFVGDTGTIDIGLWNAEGNGTVTIRFYANDTLGNMAWEEVTILKDIIAPNITINQPIGGQVFNETSPVFEISISETNLDSIWYTFDGGTNNFTILVLIDSIDQGLWDITSNGNVTITFYANDTLGNLGFNSVIVNKSVIDILGPILSALVERSDPIELGNAITIQIDTFDISNISSVQIDIKGTRYDMNYIGGDTYEYQWTPGAAEIISYTIYANDSIGNINSIIDSVKVQDTILPMFSNLIESPELVNPNDDIIIFLDATDISGINEIILSFEGSNFTMTNTSGNTWSYTITAPSTDGTYYYTIYITDNNNNVNLIEGSIRVGSPVSDGKGGTTDMPTITIFLGIIGVLGIVNIVLILKKFRGGKS